ncbi:LOW QUALITY PROTEIN: uncharacterized protein LOC124645984 [Helicoverpa zea]|uniref:LOW QUALITY PROTEIN: uncharacterized protein LOC124645984 n=1 Tax=Helicoverpa zea TaxID=7113 RepID=UPI001F5890E6|nr:LOW QUALITY PROTEIN: uncharacterized protein LOC124645984 [Helicoverpa zea]
MRARALLFLLVVYATYSHAEKSKFYYMDSLCKDHFLQRQYRKVDGGVLWSRNERNLDCTVTFQTHSILQRFMLHFDLLQLDCNDHLYVYDGAHATAPPKADLSCRNTKQQVGALFTRSNFVTLKYVTDNWGTDANGFRLVITAVKDPIPEHGCKEFRCKQREFCVSADLMCDGVDHCADGSDEDTAALCPESGGTGASGAWVAGIAGAAALLAVVAAGVACCACRRRAANQRTRLHLQELASSNGGGCAGGEAGATRLPGNPEPPAGPCGRRGRAACGGRPERRAAQGRVVRLAARGPQGGARPPPATTVTLCKFIDMTLNIFGLPLVCYWVVFADPDPLPLFVYTL